MKLLGIFRDSTPNNVPKGFAGDIRNFVNKRKLGVQINENGSIIYQKPNSTQDNKYNLSPLYIDVETRRYQIGRIPIDGDRTVLFSIGFHIDPNESTDILYSEIGIIDKEGYYTYVLNDYDDSIYTAENKLGFTAENVITGEHTYNYKNDLIIAFTDNNVPPKLMNLTFYQENPPSGSTPFDINDIFLFPNRQLATVGAQVNNTGGVLKSGVYSLVYKYRNAIGIETNYGPIDNPISIYTPSFIPANANLRTEGSEAEEATTKSITYTLTNVDTRFDFLTIAIVAKIDGILTYKEISEVPIGSSTVTYTYTGAESTTDLTSDELLIGNPTFDKIKHFTQVDRRLYAAELTERERVLFQKYANTIELTCVSTFISPDGVDTSKLKEHFYDAKGHQHREVYAAYIHLVFPDGKFSEGFHIPGLNKNTFATDPTVLTSWSVLSTYYKYQIEDTTEVITSDPDNESEIKIGYWENETELYPNTDQFDSSDVGGEDLRGQKVRHHRMPSFAWTKQNIYSSKDGFGRDNIDILGIKANNVVIPPEILYNNGTDDTDGYKVVGWTLSYAKRDYINCTVIGQALPVFEVEQTSPTPSDIYYTGAGINSNYAYGTISPPVAYGMTMNGYRMRFPDFSLLSKTPAISPVFLTHELKYSNTPDWNTDSTNRVAYGIDMTDGANTTVVSSNQNGSGLVNSANKYQRVSGYDYIPSQGVLRGFIHTYNEDCLMLTTSNEFTSADMTAGAKAYNGDSIVVDFSALGYKATLATLCAVPSNIYASFFEQDLIWTGQIVDSTEEEGTFYKGDIFINYYSFHSTTWSIGLDDINELSPDEAMVAWHEYICEHRDNVGLRYHEEGDYNTYHRPETEHLGEFYVRSLDRSNIETAKLYNNDFSSQNDLNPLVPYNPYTEFIGEHLYRIYRTIEQKAEDKRLAWSIWPVNDYYESIKDKGRIRNIQGTDRDLYINHEQALLITVGNEVLANDGSTTALGTGNIFQRRAQEIAPSKEGTIGTTDKFGCLLTKYGYITFDRKQGRVWLINNRQPVEISAQGLTEFFKDNLDYTLEINDDIVFSEDNPFFFFSISAAFDNENERLIFTKKAYEPTEALLEGLEDEDIIYENGRFLIIEEEASTVILFSNTTYWTSKSFTYSYSFDNPIDNSSWAASHSYIPDNIYNTRNLVIGSIQAYDAVNATGTRLYKHNYEDNKCIFYQSTIYDIDINVESSTPDPSYIVPVFNTQDEIDKLFFNVYWISHIINPNGAYLSNMVFNKILAWNSYQSTDEITLVLFSPTDLTTNVRKVQNTWNFNNLRDELREDILTDPSPTEPFIVDYSLNSTMSPAPIDLNKDFNLVSRLIDKFLFVKLLYSNAFDSNLQNEIQVVEVGCEYQTVPR